MKWKKKKKKKVIFTKIWDTRSCRLSNFMDKVIYIYQKSQVGQGSCAWWFKKKRKKKKKKTKCSTSFWTTKHCCLNHPTQLYALLYFLYEVRWMVAKMSPSPDHVNMFSPQPVCEISAKCRGWSSIVCILIPLDRLHRSHITEYHCGYVSEYLWGYSAATACKVATVTVMTPSECYILGVRQHEINLAWNLLLKD